jgi:hypothetical protein
MRKYLSFFFLIVTLDLYSQEALLSPNEVYYDFLNLGGYIERPYLNYRTLSDSTWDDNNNTNTIWSNVNLGRKKSINDEISYKIFGPELFTSYNTAYPYGQNDSTLWQGKGFNMLFNAGARLELYGFELTLRPEIAFSQNRSFDLMPPSSYYSTWKEASQYGHYGIAYVDAPQRFGDNPYYEFSWGDSEIRYSWKTLTIGFGTQNIWLGPAKINPILLSNNAPPWPKLDFGLRKQAITIRNIYFGDIETRIFGGMLSESDFFDDDDSNDHNLITGFSLSYSFPWVLKGFTIGYNRVMLSKWDNMDYQQLTTLLIPFFTESGYDEADQRSSITFNYLFSKVGFELYFEWARNDASGSINGLLKNPFHTQSYTFGARKNLLFTSTLQGELLLEISNLESSRDYELAPYPTSFYVHHIVTQGHTNRGQWLGAGMGTGGNSQYLGLKLFYYKGYATVFINRQNPDKDYLWFRHQGGTVADKSKDYGQFRTFLSFGINNYINIYSHLGFFSELVYSRILDRKYNDDDLRENNVYVSFGIKFIF